MNWGLTLCLGGFALFALMVVLGIRDMLQAFDRLPAEQQQRIRAEIAADDMAKRQRSQERAQREAVRAAWEREALREQRRRQNGGYVGYHGNNGWPWQ